MCLRREHLNAAINSPNGILGPASPSCDRFPTSPLIKSSLEFSPPEYRFPTSADDPPTSCIHHNEVPDILCGALYRRDTVEALLIIPRH